MNTKKETFVDLSILFMLGLAPLLWFQEGSFIKSVDMDIPITFVRWLNYFYLWNNELGAGVARTFDIPSLIFFFTQLPPQWFGFSLLTAQKFAFVFWFFLPGLSMYYLIRQLVDSRASRLAALIGASFYMFNLYLEPIWIGFNVSNLSIYALLPLLLTFFIQGLEGKRNPVQSIFYIGLGSILASGVACNPPMFLVASLPFLLFLLFSLIKKPSQKRTRLNMIGFSLGVFVVTILLNLYWILPFSQSLFSGSSLAISSSTKTLSHDWLEGVSSHTSLYNVIRMQGDWTWYAGYRYYADLYQSNPFFIALSWVIPLLTLVGLFFTKNRHKLFFGSLLLIGIVLGTGSHAPFKTLYYWLVNHFPFFWTIRSPWYKFTLLTCIGYSFFVALAISKIHKIFLEQRARKRVGILFVSSIFSLNLIYAFPVTTGKMFMDGNKSSYPNHFTVPPYIHDAADWLNEQDKENPFFRVFTLPGKGFWHNSWGFSGYYSLLNYLINLPVIYDNHPTYIPFHAPWSTPWTHLIKLYRKSLDEGDGSNLSFLLNLLNVKYLLHEKDYRYETLPEPDSVSAMEEKLDHQFGMNRSNTFGQWDFYQVEKLWPHCYLQQKGTLVLGGSEALVALSNQEEKGNSLLFFHDQLSKSEKDFLLNSDKIQRVVFYHQEADKRKDEYSNQIQTLIKDPKEELSFFFSTKDLVKEIQDPPSDFLKPPKTIQWKIKEGSFYFPEAWKDGNKWQWIKRFEEVLVIENRSSQLHETNLLFTVYNVRQDRTLEVYVNGERIHRFKTVLKDSVVQTVLLKKVRLKTGKNNVKFTLNGSPYRGKNDLFPEDSSKNRYAAFRNFQIGSIPFQKRIFLPARDNYQFFIYPVIGKNRKESELTKKQKRILFLDKKKIKLKEKQTGSGSPYWVSEKDYSLKEEIHEIRFNQQDATQYHIEIRSLGEAPLTQRIESVTFKKINPTEYEIQLQNQEPVFLILSETFHQNWEAQDQKGNLLPHFQTNVYANSFYVEKTGEHQITIEFTPQQLFQMGGRISLLTLILLLSLFIFSLRKRS